MIYYMTFTLDDILTNCKVLTHEKGEVFLYFLQKKNLLNRWNDSETLQCSLQKVNAVSQMLQNTVSDSLNDFRRRPKCLRSINDNKMNLYAEVKVYFHRQFSMKVKETRWKSLSQRSVVPCIVDGIACDKMPRLFSLISRFVCYS